MRDIGGLIDRIFDHLARIGRPVARLRGSPQDPLSVRRRIAALGLEPPVDVIEAYSAADGTTTRTGDSLEAIWLFPGYYWMSLDQVVGAYHALRRNDQWSSDWLPVFASGGGDFYAVSCRASDQGGVVGFILGETDQYVEHDSLGALFEIIERSLAESAFFVGAKGFEADYSKMRQIASLVSPGFVEYGTKVTGN
jgi:hypothetical protein